MSEFEAEVLRRLGGMEDRLGSLETGQKVLIEKVGSLEAGQKVLTEKVDALADLPEKVDRIFEVVQGQAAARVTTDERLTALERRVADLEQKAG